MPVSSTDVDVHVGGRMRQRREALMISQGRLGRLLGITFSQIQKFEKGKNRIGAGRLYQIADILGVPPSWFFEGFERPGGVAPPVDKSRLPEETRLLVDAFEAIDSPDTRASVLALVRSMATSREESGHPAVPAADHTLT